jgi:hypothetical protein
VHHGGIVKHTAAREGGDDGDIRHGNLDMGIYTLCRAAGLLLALLSLAAQASAAEYYGYDPGGSRFAPLDQITPGNVDEPCRP